MGEGGIVPAGLLHVWTMPRKGGEMPSLMAQHLGVSRKTWELGTTAAAAAGITSHAWLSPTAGSQSNAAIWARNRGWLSEHMKKKSGTVQEPKISD